MIICVCSDVTQEVIADLYAQGRTLDQVKEITNAAAMCGACRSHVEQLFYDSKYHRFERNDDVIEDAP